MSLPIVNPSDAILDKFWTRMAELTARDHDVNDNWIRCNEVCEWNHTNHTVRLEIHNNRQVVQKLHEPHAAFFHCAKPHGKFGI